MTIQINGTGTIAGLSAGGLPDLSVTPDDLSQKLTLGTAVVTTSGTSAEFTGIPSWAKRITLMFNGVSVNNSAGAYQVQIGSGSFDIASYIGSAGVIRHGGTSNNYANSTGFIVIGEHDLGNNFTGSVVLTLSGANTWVAAGNVGDNTGSRFTCTGGVKVLSGVLDRLRVIASASGSPSHTFDAGSVNILYEG